MTKKQKKKNAQKNLMLPVFGANMSHLTQCPRVCGEKQKNAFSPVFRGALGTNSRAKTAYSPRKGGKKEEKNGKKIMGA